jgi:hypothetical protein
MRHRQFKEDLPEYGMVIFPAPKLPSPFITVGFDRVDAGVWSG